MEQDTNDGNADSSWSGDQPTMTRARLIESQQKDRSCCPEKITRGHKKLTDTIFDTLTPYDNLSSLPTNGFTLELYKYKIANKLTVNKTNKAAKTFQI